MGNCNDVFHIVVDCPDNRSDRTWNRIQGKKEIYTCDLGTRHIACRAIDSGSIATSPGTVPLYLTLPEELSRSVLASQPRVEIFFLTTEGQQVAVALAFVV